MFKNNTRYRTCDERGNILTELAAVCFLFVFLVLGFTDLSWFMSERTDLVQATQRAARQISRISGPQFEAGNKALLCQTARNFAHRSLLQAGLQPVNFEVLVKEPDSFWNGGTRAVQVTIKQKFAQSLAGAQSIHIFKAGYLAQSTFVFEHDVQLNGACPV